MFEKLRNILFPGEKEEHPLLKDFSLMAVDIHSHLIPGIDDGVKTIDDSLFLLERFKELGFRKVITSPHVMADGYVNSTETILKGRDAVRAAMQDRNIDLDFDSVAEYNIDEGLYPRIEQRDLLIIGKNFVMVEMPFSAKPVIMADIGYKLQTAGYNVILAHPERYPYYHEKDFAAYYRLKDHNWFFQINLGSLTGIYGKGAKYTAERMIRENMVDFTGSDIHGANGLGHLYESLKSKYLEKILTYDKLLNKTLI